MAIGIFWKCLILKEFRQKFLKNSTNPSIKIVNKIYSKFQKFIIVLALIAIVAADVSKLSFDSKITTKLGKDGYEYPVPGPKLTMKSPVEPVAVVDDVFKPAPFNFEDYQQYFLTPF